MADLDKQLAASPANERRLRARLTELERDAVALRESRSTLMDTHVAEMGETRKLLNLATRESTRIRELMRKQEGA